MLISEQVLCVPAFILQHIYNVITIYNTYSPEQIQTYSKEKTFYWRWFVRFAETINRSSSSLLFYYDAVISMKTSFR